jgi:hypothetical protein
MTDSPRTTGSIASGIGVPALRRGYVLMAGPEAVQLVADGRDDRLQRLTAVFRLLNQPSPRSKA